jgi:hypothetical protein
MSDKDALTACHCNTVFSRLLAAFFSFSFSFSFAFAFSFVFLAAVAQRGGGVGSLIFFSRFTVFPALVCTRTESPSSR